MIQIRIAALGALLVVAGCGQAVSPRLPTTHVAAHVSDAGHRPQTLEGGPRLLGSQDATLGALRAEQGRRPALVLMPGADGPAAVQPRVTDPVSGGLELAANAKSVAWWSGGAVPGDRSGTAVLAAHVVYNGATGPFTGLRRIRPGALVMVTSADGAMHRYSVRSSRLVVKAALDPARLFTTDGPPTLALVTCGGPYDPTSHSFRDNLVVTATPV